MYAFRLLLIVVTFQGSRTYFTAKEHEAFKTLPKNPVMDYGIYSTEPDDFEKELEHIFDKLKVCRNFPGGSIAIVKPGEEVFTTSYGFVDQTTNRKRRISGNTNFQIHRVTQSFTAVLLVIVLSEYNNDNPDNVITFNTKVQDILGPEYNLSNSYITEEVTLKDLMSSRVGFQQLIELTEASIYNRENFSRENMSKALKYMDEMKPFRGGYYHNHYNWMLLGHIAEKMTGMSWEWLIKNKILKPARMDRVRIWKSKRDVYRRDTVHPLWVDVETNMEMLKTSDEFNEGRYPFEPSVGLIVNANDMAKWIYILLTNGQAPNGNEIFDSALYFDTFEPSNFLPVESPRKMLPIYPISAETHSISLPWAIGNYREFEVHSLISAGLFGTSAALVLLRDVNIGIFVATSGPGVSLNDLYENVLNPILYYLMDSVLYLERFYTEENICTYPLYNDPRDLYRNIDERYVEDVVTKQASTAHVINRREIRSRRIPMPMLPSITGTYVHPLYGMYIFSESENQTDWRQSEYSYGTVDIQNRTIPQVDVTLNWDVPVEFSNIYELNCRFFDTAGDKYQKFQILENGPIYELMDIFIP